MRTLITVFFATAALSGCSPTTTLPHPIANPATKPPCVLNLPMRGATLPTAGPNSYLAPRRGSVSRGTTHDGVELMSDSPLIFAVRPGKINMYAGKVGEGVHSKCVSIMVANDDKKTTLDVYCGLNNLADIRTELVQTGQLLGYAHSPARGTYAIHFGISELSQMIGGGVSEIFYDPQQVLKAANDPTACR